MPFARNWNFPDIITALGLKNQAASLVFQEIVEYFPDTEE